MLSAVALAPVSERWPGTGRDGDPHPAQLAWWV